MGTFSLPHQKAEMSKRTLIWENGQNIGVTADKEPGYDAANKKKMSWILHP